MIFFKFSVNFPQFNENQSRTTGHLLNFPPQKALSRKYFLQKAVKIQTLFIRTRKKLRNKLNKEIRENRHRKIYSTVLIWISNSRTIECGSCFRDQDINKHISGTWFAQNIKTLFFLSAAYFWIIFVSSHRSFVRLKWNFSSIVGPLERRQ